MWVIWLSKNILVDQERSRSSILPIHLFKEKKKDLTVLQPGELFLILNVTGIIIAAIWHSYLYFDGSAEVIPPPVFNAEGNGVVKTTTCKTYNFLVPFLKAWPQPMLHPYSKAVPFPVYTSGYEPQISLKQGACKFGLILVTVKEGEKKCFYGHSVDILSRLKACRVNTRHSSECAHLQRNSSEREN